MTITPPFDPEAIARELISAKARRETHPSIIAKHPGLRIEDGYAVGAAITALRRQAGERPVGRKIGLTQPSGWAALGADAPIWGYVYDTTLRMAETGAASINLDAAIAPRIEPEIGFCLRSAVDPEKLDFETLLDAIDWIAPCFEIVDSHYEGWKFKAPEAVADFGVHYALVVGEPLRLGATQRDTLAARLASCTVELSRNGTVIAKGCGANTLGHPLSALAALATLLSTQPDAAPLAAGEIITTGTLTPAQPINAGEQWAMRVAGLELTPLTLSS